MKNVNVSKILDIIKCLEDHNLLICFKVSGTEVIEPIATTSDLIGFLAATRRQDPKDLSAFLLGVKARREVARTQPENSQ